MLVLEMFEIKNVREQLVLFVEFEIIYCIS